MESFGIVVLNELADDSPGILKREGCSGPDTFAFDRLMPPLNLAVALRIIGRCPDMRHSRNTDKLLSAKADPLSGEIPRDELRPIIRNNPGRHVRKTFPGSLKNNLYLLL